MSALGIGYSNLGCDDCGNGFGGAGLGLRLPGGSNIEVEMPDPEAYARQLGQKTLDWLKPKVVKMAKDDIVPALIQNARPAIRGLVDDALERASDKLHDELPELLTSIRGEIPGAVRAAFGAVPKSVKVGAGVAVGLFALSTAFSFMAWRASRRCGAR